MHVVFALLQAKASILHSLDLDKKYKVYKHARLKKYTHGGQSIQIQYRARLTIKTKYKIHGITDTLRQLSR